MEFFKKKTSKQQLELIAINFKSLKIIIRELLGQNQVTVLGTGKYSVDV